MFSVFLFCLVSVLSDFSQSFVLDENSNKLHDLDWQCDTICSGSGGRARFDPQHKICKCTMDKNTDETEIFLMQKNARDLGLQIITCEEYRELEKREINEKRDINKNQQTKIEGRVGIQMPKIPNLEILKPLSRNAVVPEEKPIVAPKKSILPIVKNVTEANSKTGKKEYDLRARLLATMIEARKKLDRMWEEREGKLPTMKPRTSFIDTEDRANEGEKSGAKKALDLVKEKQKELTENYLSRRSRLLGRGRFHNEINHNKRSRNQSNSEQVAAADNNTVLPANTHKTDKQGGQGHGHEHAYRSPAVPNTIITQPYSTYDANRK